METLTWTLMSCNLFFSSLEKTDEMQTNVPLKTTPRQRRLVQKGLRKAVLRWGELVSPVRRHPETAAVKGFLPIDPIDFACVTREKVGGQLVKNRCLRDALWFVLHYYYPRLFDGNESGDPKFIESIELFGPKVPDWFPVGDGVQFSRVFKTLRAFKIAVAINGEEVRSDGAVIWSIVSRFIRPFGVSFKNAVGIIRDSLTRAEPCIIFVPLNCLLEHALFVYGVSGNYLHCVDTHTVVELPYFNISGDPNRFVMDFPLNEVETRWNRLGMVWTFHLARDGNV